MMGLEPITHCSNEVTLIYTPGTYFYYIKFGATEYQGHHLIDTR